MPSLNPASNFDESVAAARLLAQSYQAAVDLLGHEGFASASQELRELIQRVARGEGVSLLAAGGLVANDLHATGKLNSSTRLMIRSTVFSLYAAKGQNSTSTGSNFLEVDPTQN